MLLLVVVLHCLLGGARSLNGTAPAFPAVIAFGDSIFDTGNNNLLPTVAKANFPPYGQDFSGHRPTGRFSNGKVPVDLVASGLGIKEFLPAYLNLEISSEDLLTGVCFASGASGFDPLTSKLQSVLSLRDQLELFKEYKEKLQVIAGDEKATIIIKKSLYIICTGSNDVVNTYFGTYLRKVQYDFSTYANFLVHSASNFVKELYNLGARKIAIVGLPPLGCIPSQRTLVGGIQRNCVTLYNQASKTFNYELSIVLQKLNNKLPGTKIIYVDIYEKLLHIIQHHLDYGFDEATKGCCGTGEFEASILCNSLSSNTCVDDSKYVFWDSFHPTQKAYELVVDEIIQIDLPLLL